MYQPRTYRDSALKKGLVAFRVVVKETDLHIQAECDLTEMATRRVMAHRSTLENYIRMNPGFATTHTPWLHHEVKPLLIQQMADAGRRAGTGPMASVAGAIAEFVGRDLLAHSREVIVENGGDVYLRTENPVIVGIDAGSSAVGSRMGIRIPGRDDGIGVCTSSGRIGHSFSYGRADAVSVVSGSCLLSDAAATAIGNRVRGAGDIREAILWGRSLADIIGIVVMAEGKVGAWGEIELVPVKGKKG